MSWDRYGRQLTRLQATDRFTLCMNGVPSTIPSQPAVKFFNDLKDFWDPATPLANVKTPDTGTIIEIRSYNAQGNFMQVQVRPAKYSVITKILGALAV